MIEDASSVPAINLLNIIVSDEETKLSLDFDNQQHQHYYPKINNYKVPKSTSNKSSAKNETEKMVQDLYKQVQQLQKENQQFSQEVYNLKHKINTGSTSRSNSSRNRRTGRLDYQ